MVMRKRCVWRGEDEGCGGVVEVREVKVNKHRETMESI